MSYQNIPGISNKYERDCTERWQVIKPHLPGSGLVLDIGAAEGYFCKKIADETDLLAVAIEKNPGRVRFQHRWLSNGYAGKVVSCNSNINTALIEKISRTPEFIDSCLLLSTLHWINSDDFLMYLSKFCGQVFVEIPDMNDYKATGQNFMNRVRRYNDEYDYFKTVTGRDVKLIAKVKAHTYPTRNLWLIDGPLTRRPDIPHIDYERITLSRFYQSYKNGNIKYTKNEIEQKWTPGINLATLRAFGVTYPDSEWWAEKIKESISRLEKQSNCDLRIHNLIVSRNKFTWIDLDHHGHRTTIFEDILNMVKIVTK